MLDYFKKSFARKKARRVTQKYPVRIDTFSPKGAGDIKFANWLNPLVSEKHIESDTIDFFKKWLQPGAMAIDIGANIGLMSTTMAAAAGKEGLVLSFDPNPMVFEILEQNAQLNPELARIKAFNYAISEEDDEFYYSSSEASFNNGGIAKEKDNHHGKFTLDETVKGIALQAFVESNFQDKLNRLAIIKIDTEGYDKEIIRSIKPLLMKYKPVLITECFGGNDDAAKFEQFNMLKEMGYDLQYFSDFSANAEYKSLLKQEDMLQWKHFDILAKPH